MLKTRTLGKTGFQVTEIGLGTWQVGGKWGAKFDDSTADAILNRAVDLGVNFIDTADVYGDGKSEHAVGRLVRQRTERIYVATKCGRRFQPHNSASYTPGALRKSVEDSLRNTGLDHIDLIQLHCPPNEVFYRPELFGVFADMKREGKISHMGVSVEKVEQAIKAIEYPNVTTVQIIFNMFRQRPADLFFGLAAKNNVGVIARVPLASGLLTGKFSRRTEFKPGDHRNDNRNGELFDKGETFSGLDYEMGLDSVNAIQQAFPGRNLVDLALQWILQFGAVSTVIPGASSVSQVESNIVAAQSRQLSSAEMQKITDIYMERVRDSVHHLW